jgi:hypothetical protein
MYWDIRRRGGSGKMIRKKRPRGADRFREIFLFRKKNAGGP